MKFLIIAVLLLLLCLVIYWRVRPYLKLARRVLDSARAVRDIGAAPGGARVPQERRGAQETLVRCDSCETWFPASRKVPNNASVYAFCSSACASAGRRQANSSRVNTNKL